MNDRWFYCKDGERSGPLALNELQGLVASGALHPSDFVWHPEFGSHWRKVSEVAELTQQPTACTPPPLKTAQRVAGFDSEPGGECYCPSVATAIRSSWQWTRMALLHPFNATRWFGIGFCAWLASLGGCNGINLRDKAGEGGVGKSTVDVVVGESVDILKNPASLSALIIGGLVILVIYILILRLKSRGDFMFLRRWYTPDAMIGNCWRESRVNGDRFFRWRLSFYALLLMAALLNTAFIYKSFLMPYANSGYVWEVIYARPLALSTVAALVIWLVFLIGEGFGVGFVVPILHWHGCSVAQGWRKVFEFCNQFPGAVLLYALSLVGMWLCFAVALALVIVMTCCIAALPLMIPYVGIVALLPVHFFFRGYSICFIAQWRENFVPGADTKEEVR